MDIPKDYYFTKDHEWLSTTTGEATVGISSYALAQLGDIIHIDLPSVGDTLQPGESFGSIESTKTVSDLYSPGAGEVIAVNDELFNQPEKISAAPYTVGWLIKIKLTQTHSDLFTTDEYIKFTQEEH